MHVEFPKLADTLVDGVVSAWYKKPGDTVKKGEPLFAVETDKVNADVESPHDGVLAEILVPEGERAEVGQLLARFAGAGGVEAPPIASSPHTSPAGVHTAVSRPMRPPAANGGLTPMRRRIAERMTEARATIAQGSCARLVDLSGIERRGVSWTAYFVKAFAQALEADRIGVAVEIPGGLIVPVVPDARDASLHDISVRIADLAERARTNALKPVDVGNAAATVTNVGATGTLLAFPLIAPGEPAILAPGAIAEGRCWLALCYDRARYDEFAADRLLGDVANRVVALR
ncbi:MAG TPA: 2-oxo acid dehydrogenase subunit E2 [Candidatus Elarobacter sp.]|jgi:pyruvate/2-oxoglutarate dehydrogenase complex dihydrolipoamide acyltransferase (E2) component|nr:2-oxo acid dehydrogenase subunit E2 [Candidatus Elarobacter sp.]